MKNKFINILKKSNFTKDENNIFSKTFEKRYSNLVINCVPQYNTVKLEANIYLYDTEILTDENSVNTTFIEFNIINAENNQKIFEDIVNFYDDEKELFTKYIKSYVE